MSGQLQLLIFVLDDRQYGLRLSQVQRVVRAVDATPLPNAPQWVLGAIDVQGLIVPLFNTRRRFGVSEREINLSDQFVIANTSNRTVALAVDSVKEIAERPAEEIVAADKILGRLETITGAIQLEDGLVLIHDLDRFLSLDETRAMEDALAGQTTHGT